MKKRVQIYIEESQDDALAAEAARRDTSKAAIVREAVASYLGDREHGLGPLGDLLGDIDDDPGEIDEVVYGDG